MPYGARTQDDIEARAPFGEAGGSIAAGALAPRRAALTVSIGRDGGMPRAWIARTPGPSLETLCAGRSAEEATRVAALAHSACAAAQEGAMRAALGLPAAPDAAPRIALEILRHHALKLSVAWPQALGAAPDPAAMAAAALAPRDGGRALSAALFGRSGPPRRLSAFEAWLAAGETPSARMLDHVWRRWDSRWGRCTPMLWRPGDPFLEIDWGAAEIDGRPVETSVAARVAESDLLREIEARRGRGLVWRLAARIEDSARLIEGLPEGSPACAPTTLAPGIGAAPAPRGALLVRAVDLGGRATGLARLSATDCALHPHGLMAGVLSALPRRRRAPLARVAALAIEAVDPGPAVRLRFEETALA